MSRRLGLVAACVLVVVLAGCLKAVSVPDLPEPDIVVIKTDNGEFIGSAAGGITHQRDATYKIRKIIDVPEDLLARTQKAVLQIFMSPQAHTDPGGNYEYFDIVVNDNVQTHWFGDMPNLTFWGETVKEDRKYQWNEFEIPVEWLQPGENVVIVHKTPADYYLVDYLYVGLDPTADYGKSAMSMDNGVTWRTDRLNGLGLTGEYMIRLALWVMPTDA